MNEILHLQIFSLQILNYVFDDLIDFVYYNIVENLSNVFNFSERVILLPTLQVKYNDIDE